MRHISIKLNTPCEFLDIVPVNPLISKCQIKVCYVGDTPNRNGSVITKDVARELANSLPGSPIVGLFSTETNDFEEHSRDMVIENGELVFKDITKPYGFVDLGARVWFQKFSDDGVEHEYLMTEGYIWTGRYPEAKRIIEKGNNQSMELDSNSLNGVWSKDENGVPEFFIINEAIMSALCILGEDVEPCFEGASIGNVQFSLEDSFKNQLFSMINEIKEILSKGGEPVKDTENMEVTTEFAAVEAEAEVVTTEEVVAEVTEEVAPEAEPEVEPEAEFAATEEVAEAQGEAETETVEETVEEVVEPEAEVAPTYSLEEIPEYVQLSKDFVAAQEKIESLEAEIVQLKEFKLSVERTEKQSMIEKFYMLSDEDKEDVVANIDSYSLDEIEAKLCVAYCRKGIDITEKKEDTEVTTYNLNDYASTTPAWIKAVEQHSKAN